MKRLLVLAAVASMFACASPPPEPQKPATPAEVPITSKSSEAIDHFKRGRDLTENSRFAEAVQEFDQALKLDPDFVMAMVYKANSTFGPEEIPALEQANAKAASLSKPEQLVVAATLAGRQNDFAKAEQLWKEAAAAVPTDWRVQAALGGQLFVEEKYPDALDALNKAVAINPNAGAAYNMIGYAHLFQNESGPAVEALKKYASLLPNEPNPQDSLGEALMADGKFADAEAAFRKAIALSPAFAISWDGVAYTKFFVGDWTGGNAAVASERAAGSRPVDRIAADRLGAFGALAGGKTAEGLKQLDAIGKSPDATPIDKAFMPLDRAMAMVETGKYPDAIAATDTTLSLAGGGTFPTGPASVLRRTALTVRAAAQARMGDAAGAEKTVTTLQQASAAAPDDPALKSSVHLAQGMLAVAQKDMKGAAGHFAMCSNQDSYCQWQAFEVAHKAGDAAAAAASLARLTKVYRRDPVYLYARSTAAHVAPKPSN
jgi:tetratricopeptide (TPR) repeat protein